ncbi:hypothetical protein ES708_27492 [subsurface metagenome]
MVEERDRGAGLVIGGVGGVILGATITALLAAKPAEAAPPEEKLNYLIDVLTALIPVLAEVAERQASLIQLFEQWLAAQGVEPGVEVGVRIPWVAKDPEEIYRYAISTKGTFYSNKMVDWTQGKRLVIKVESSLNWAVNIQIIGNTVDDMELATDINGPIPCAAGGNISVGLAWDDWHPYVGVRITAPPLPPAPFEPAGILTISAVVQE